MGKFKNNQKGFSAVETLMAIVIIALIVGAGWLVHSHAKTNKAITTTTKTNSTSTNTPDPKGPSQSQYNGWLSFCSSYGGLCFKYPANWKLTQAAYAPGQSATGQEVDTITSPSTNVTVTYMPSAQVTGSRRIENIKVVGVTSTDITQLKVIKLIDQITSPSSQYAVEDYVTLTSAAHALNTANTPFTPGATIANTSEPPYHQFTNPQRPGNIGQQLLAVTVANGDPGSNFFTSNANAQTWLSSSEVTTAGQILDSVTYSQ